ncbi:MAG: hypothetical protein CVV12_03580 [Gammaproteobacteria bacterium HGW-Gammaproteobacteria-2]|jgi:membrane associated rhomboid family serine protease|nr:MAG: hypothetical protein CVV12_03580 [Gammaproteobacteria bacterium HGW-Gammaproteobacteria-2]
MVFIPYKLDVSLYRVPYLTILVCLVSLATFMSQLKSDAAYERKATAYCTRALEPNLAAILRSVADAGDTRNACITVYLRLRNSPEPEPVIAEMAGAARSQVFYRDREQNLNYLRSKLSRGFADFEAQVPKPLTETLQYNPLQYSFLRMISSAFAHADWEHLLGNLFFFFIFASAVESALGSMHFAVSIVLMAVVSSLAYSYSVVAGNALPSIGLSGVAMGMMALLTTLLPRARIWCLFWFLLWVRRFSIPVMWVSLWFLGWNVYDLNHDDGSSNIDYMAHVSGALAGIVLGVLYRLFSPTRLNGLSMNTA